MRFSNHETEICPLYNEVRLSVNQSGRIISGSLESNDVAIHKVMRSGGCKDVGKDVGCYGLTDRGATK